MFKTKKKSDDEMHISLCKETAILLYNIIDDKIFHMEEDSSERATLMALRSCINLELKKCNVIMGNILANADFSYLPEIQESMKYLVKGTKGYRKKYPM